MLDNYLFEAVVRYDDDTNTIINNIPYKFLNNALSDIADKSEYLFGKGMPEDFYKPDNKAVLVDSCSVIEETNFEIADEFIFRYDRFNILVIISMMAVNR